MKNIMRTIFTLLIISFSIVFCMTAAPSSEDITEADVRFRRYTSHVTSAEKLNTHSQANLTSFELFQLFFIQWGIASMYFWSPAPMIGKR